jgi:hypothetical protein
MDTQSTLATQENTANKYKYKITNDKSFCNGINSFGTPNPIMIENNIYEFKYFKTGGNMFEQVFYSGVNCEDRWISINEIRNAVPLVRV